MINLIRCDDRLIHGQCMTRLVQHYHIKRIIVIDEFTASDSTMRFVIEKVAMPGMKNEVYNVQDSIAVVSKAITSDVSTMVVFRFPNIAKTLFDNIEALPKFLMVGPVQKSDNSFKVQEGTYCTHDDFVMFDDLKEKGVDVFFQVVPDNKRIDWKDISSKMLSL